MTDLKVLRNEDSKEVYTFSKVTKPSKIKIVELTPENCKKLPALAKYFKVNNKFLDRFHIPEITKAQYEELAKEFNQGARFDKKNLKFETATDYYIRKARVLAIAKDLGISANLLDTTDYIWDERYYTEYNFWHNVDVVEDAWREEGEDLRNASAYKVYIEMDAKSNALDEALWDSLYKFCYKAIVSRKAMLLCKVDKCLSFLFSVVEYSNGFKENITSAQKATLSSYFEFFTELLKDEKGAEFIKSTNDVEVFAKCEATHNDYVETYRSMLRSLIRCKGDELEFFRTDLSDVEDPYIEEILAKEIDPEDLLSGSYLENEDGDADEYEEVVEDC